MTDLPTSDIQFDGVGATAGSAEEAARVLAVRLNHWRADHPHCRIVEFRVQSASNGANLELTAILVFLEQTSITETIDQAAEAIPEPEATIAQAEEIIAASEAQQERGA